MMYELIALLFILIGFFLSGVGDNDDMDIY